MSKSDLPARARTMAASLLSLLLAPDSETRKVADLLDALADEVDRLRKRRKLKDVRTLPADELVQVACSLVVQARDQIEETLRRAGVEPVPDGAAAGMVAAVADALDVRGVTFWQSVEWTLNAIKGKAAPGPCPVAGCGGE